MPHLEYYQFNTILQAQLLEQEKENFTFVLETMAKASEQAIIYTEPI